MVQDPITNLKLPEYVVESASSRIPVNDYPAKMEAIPQSRMFTIKEALDKYTAKAGADAPTYDASQGDGGDSLPGVPRYILERALELQLKHGTGYDKPFGTDQFRQVAANQYWQLDSATGWGPGNIAFVQGGRDGLNKAYAAMIALGHGRVGDLVVVSRVPWITYNWGPYSMGLNVLLAPGNPDEGWRYTPDGIRECVSYAAREGRKIAGIVITSPDNPTGRTLSIEEQVELGKAALEAGISFVLYDWIYHWVTDGGPSDINKVLMAFEPEERNRLMFLDGITKSLGASNIRSAHLLASKDVMKYLISQASHGVIPSYYAQAVAIAAYEEGFGKAAASIIQPTSASRKVLRAALDGSGMRYVMGDGYYAFIDTQSYIEAAGFGDSERLGSYLGEEYGVAVVPGKYFSEAGAQWVRFSYALPPERTEAAISRMLEGLNALL